MTKLTERGERMKEQATVKHEGHEKVVTYDFEAGTLTNGKLATKMLQKEYETVKAQTIKMCKERDYKLEFVIL